MTDNNIKQIFDELMAFESHDAEIKHDALLICSSFLSEICITMEKNGISKKQLAEAIGTNQAHITMLFRGDRMLNPITIAKIQKALNIRFEIKAILD